VVVLGVELAAPPVESEPVVPDGELVLPELEPGVLELELEPLPLVPGPPIELVPPLLLGELLLLLAVLSVLLLPLGLVLAVLGLLVLLLLGPGVVLAVLGLVGEVLVDELVEPVAPVEPGAASRFVQAPSERAAATATVAAAHCVRDIFIRNS
jgi:hypothetical protein